MGQNKVTTVYLVRHGTTAWNQALRYQGRADNPLDEIGERQGACLESYFKDIRIDLGVTSPLQRAVKTLEYCLASQDHEVPILIEPDVIEIDFGVIDGWMVQVYDRMTSAVMRIAREHPGQNIVISSHGTAIQTFLNFASGISADQVKRFLLYNVCVSCVEIDENGRAAVKYIGDKHHVPEELQFSYGSIPKK